MEQQAPAYDYVPLSGPRMVRILVVEPARSKTMPIRCSFLEGCLDDADSLNFEALSYTWGMPKGTNPIFCDGRIVLITPNCEQALLHLRRSSKPRRIWVDAICINQQSVQEKNIQVPLMGDIYHGATRAILWLGPGGDPDLAKVLRHAARYGHAYNCASDLWKRLRKRKGGENLQSSWSFSILCDKATQESERIAELCSREWFSRIWTIQEFLLAKSAVFMLGEQECPALPLYIYYHLGQNLVKRVDLEHFRARNALSQNTMDLDTVSGFRNFMNVVVQLVAQNNVSDPRDKIFGMQAFLRNRLPGLDIPTVDYERSLQQVYEEFTRFLIYTSASLWPLEVSGTPKPRSTDLPSWVLDLRDFDLIGPDWTWNWTSRSHRSANNNNYDMPAESKLGKLPIWAKMIAKVARKSSKMPSWDSQSTQMTAEAMDKARMACLSAWAAFALDLDMHEDHADSAYRFHSARERGPFGRWHASNCHWSDSNGGFCEEPYTRALQCFTQELDYLRLRHTPDDDTSILGETPYPSSGRSRDNKEALKQLEDKKKTSLKASSVFDDEPRMHDMCTLFLTSSGHLAETPGDVQVGDGVFIVDGVQHALVLRHSSSNEYILVGKARIHEIHYPDKTRPDDISDDPGAGTVVLV
ncbi:hypothetical protein S40293_08841 [Stachybotrys chartarum IBT 40293]|nr:hypothetical protein S40293_08841 [Stachybotrys chartarum IBT 40293]